MASVRKRDPKDPKSPWQVDYKDQDGKRRNKAFDKKKDADTFKQKVERELFDHTHVAAGATTTFAALAKEFLMDCERRHRIGDSMSGNTLDLARRLSKIHLEPFFGATLLTDITNTQIRQLVESKAETYSRVMVVKLVVHMRMMLQLAMDRGYLKRNVVRDQPPRIPLAKAAQIEIPTIEQLRRLVQTVEDRPREFRHRLDGPLMFAIVVYLALLGGLRRGEICALEWGKVKFDAGVIEVRHSLSRYDGIKAPKTQAGVRDVPMTSVLREKLVAMHKLQGEPASGPVLRNRYGNAISPDELARWYWTPMAEAADLRRKDGTLMGLHTLRHAAASLWIRGGLGALPLKKAIGHSSISTTMDVYGHLFPEDDAVRNATNGAYEALTATAIQPPRRRAGNTDLQVYDIAAK